MRRPATAKTGPKVANSPVTLAWDFANGTHPPIIQKRSRGILPNCASI
ncbi:hypothetical protein Hsw_0775 [Hymenobacter swuensis DY53]|uniref:Uncharacterized protein n=1 Tax=Hymenobacter swuensis DY53 TaxID=1227739 RepID=W8F3J7_9BACT|nr:hypothetical protein Hsw_0775 [Hymenobacter swuensis DY53]